MYLVILIDKYLDSFLFFAIINCVPMKHSHTYIFLQKLCISVGYSLELKFLIQLETR